MVTGDQPPHDDASIQPADELAEIAEVDKVREQHGIVKQCRAAWHDGKSGHICGEPAGHDGPHICATDNAKSGQAPAPETKDPNRRYGYFPG
ncbi:hypothetical protein ACXJJ3_26680 [Kribbella sp. WER1]